MPRAIASVTLAAVTCLIATASAQTPSVSAVLETRLPDVTFEEVPFDTAVEWLAEQTSLTIHVRWERLAEFGIERDAPVSLKARNLPVSQVLWLLMNQIGGDVRLAYRGSGELLVLSTEDDLGREMLTRVYDVRDLLDRTPRFTNAARLNPSAALSQQGGTNAVETRDDDRDVARAAPDGGDAEGAAFLDLITETIEPNSWETNSGRGRVVYWRGRIVVHNTLLVHEQLAGRVSENE